MAEIRALDRTARCMQRLGYLKRLVRRVVSLETSSLNNLGTDLVETVTRKAQVPLTVDRVAYVRQRLYDRVYNGLKKQANDWQEGQETVVAMELQDLYLADPTMPSQTGKLVRNDWRKYPPLGVALGLIRAGTYSPNTRALSLLHFTPEEELEAFLDYCPEANPLCLSRAQSLLLLYSLLESDGEVIALLFSKLASESVGEFSDREAGDRLPAIYYALVRRHQSRLLSADDREQLQILSQVADNVAKWKGQSYTGGGARENTVRVRLEPSVDAGLLTKPDPVRYTYAFTPAGMAWAGALAEVEGDAQIGIVLARHFFEVAARAWEIRATPVSDPGVLVHHLYRAWQAIQSTGGYAPIKEMALVAGIEALLGHGLIIEPAVARDAIVAYQKANPYKVRFSVDRMGVLAHARFLEAPAEHAEEARS